MRVAVLTMQKNEEALLPAWAEYHGKLFGLDNLFVFDNGSTSERNLEQLDILRNQGVNVNADHNTARDFENKGRLVSELINSMMDRYDFFVPADVDEFLALDRELPMTHSREDILAEFARLGSAVDQYIRVKTCYYNLAHSTRVRVGETRKLVIKSGQPVDIDEGFHLWDWSRSVDTTPTKRSAPSNFAHVHFHRRDYKALLRSAREKLKLRVPSFRASVLENYTGHANHLIPYFSMSLESYRDELWVDNTKDIQDAWAAWGIGSVPFSSGRTGTAEALDRALDPVNVAHIQLKGSLSADALTMLREDLRNCRTMLHFGLESSLYLACEMGLTAITALEPDTNRIQKLVADPEVAAYLHLGRLRLRNPFTTDLRTKHAPKAHVDAKEFAAFFAPLADSKYDTVIFSGPLKLAAAAFYCSSPIQRRPVSAKAYFVVESEEDAAQLRNFCNLRVLHGQLVELQPDTGMSAQAETLFATIRKAYVKPT